MATRLLRASYVAIGAIVTAMAGCGVSPSAPRAAKGGAGVAAEPSAPSASGAAAATSGAPGASLVTRVGRAFPKCSTLSADGKHLYTGGADEEVRVVDLETDTAVSWAVRGCPLSPANRVVFVRDAGKLRAVDAQSGAVRWTHEPDAYPSSITDEALLFGPNAEGKLPIVRASGASLSADTGKNVARTTASRDGKLGFVELGDISTANDLRMVDLVTGAQSRRWSIGQYSPELEASADGARLATAFERSVSLWDTTSGTAVRDLRGFDNPTALRFSDDGKQIAVGDPRGVRVHDVETGERVLAVESKFGLPDELRFTGAGELVALYGEGPRWPRRWRIDTQQEIPYPQPNLGDITSAAWVDDESVLVAVQQYAVHLIRLKDARIASTWLLSRDLYRGESIDALVVVGKQCLASSGRHLWTLDVGGTKLAADDPASLGFTARWSSDGAWRVVDMEQGNGEVSLDHDGATQAIPTDVYRAPSVEAGNVALVTVEETIRVWSGTSHAFTAVDQPTAQSRVLVLSPDGKSLLLGQSDAILVGVGDNRVVWKLSQTAPSGDRREVNAAAFSKDGKKVAIGTGGDILLVDTATGAPLARWSAHIASVQTLAFSPDQRRLLSAGRDGTLAVWSLPTTE